MPYDIFHLLAEAQSRLDEGFAHLPPAPAPPLDEIASAILNQVASRLQDNYPYAHPLYAGQMLKPPHPIARAAYALAMSVNPNNHALDGGRASSAMEIEAVAALAKMFHWPKHLGHLSSGGTFANLEALWVAGQLAPGKAIAASDQAHYTHNRISSVLGLPFFAIPSDDRGRIDLHALERLLETQNIGTVVVTLGTTAIGSVDPLDQVLVLQKKFNFRIHVDAAYGGYFTLASNLSPETRAAFDAITHADSIVIDPHKHGLQPYGCGSILFRDPAVGRFYKHDSPYTYFSSKDLHLGEISLECSRAGASAVALWATQQLLPYIPGGVFAQGLEASHTAALELHRRLTESPHFLTPSSPPQLDIVFWAVNAHTPKASSALAQSIFDEAAKNDLHLALAKLPVRFFSHNTWQDTPKNDAANKVTCLRSVLMKPEHLLWLEHLWQRLQAAAVRQVGSIPR
ncbi:aminotransferase class I/II-fold pyridoxal phosphate-dependent enzyme [Tunturiibacter empetritectus]|uniref:Glutamate/tyrosine decarboxylase-like PLP-dependent enzyme n=1 Tax=Tunturiibacter lichenicola TaxID=2051959 RepID=A0A852V4H1_9BACT|nr:aminotransferase class I/II-fold pyridoxal phosphate-dependent enzyme [Edaphobacter lichenicola]NYF87948.1 glutamate/tyrosine decarboxylase-like PLP-dependent enzyme [Edaphobacter lichenicola]